MKSFIISILLLLAVILFAFFSNDFGLVDIQKIWDEAKSTVCVTVHRKEATRTETLISALEELCRREHTDTEYFGICRQLEEELRHIRELGIPSWRNIM